ncbi:MAG: VOC family protein [Alphaproteobacteria bacterium]|nr:VOC family protein [Alphaproteobacteria bacterium]
MSTAPTAKSFHHMAFEVTDIEKSIAFYRDVLGLKVTEHHQAGEVEAIPVELVFMRINENHHDLVLAHNPAKKYRTATAADATEGLPGFHHFAIEYNNREDWLTQLDRAKEMGLEIVRGPVVHSPWHPRGEGSWGENESFYILDPDGHRIELFCDMATIDDKGVFIDAYGKTLEGGVADEV